MKSQENNYWDAEKTEQGSNGSAREKDVKIIINPRFILLIRENSYEILNLESSVDNYRSAEKNKNV